MININFDAIDTLLPKIGGEAFGLLLAISRHMNIQKTCFPSRTRLMKLTGLKKDSYYKAMAILKTEGLLKSYQKPGEAGKFGKNIFTINTPAITVYIKAGNTFEGEEKEAVSEITEPCPVLPHPVAPHPVKPDTISITKLEVLPIVSKEREKSEKSEISFFSIPNPKTHFELSKIIFDFLNQQDDEIAESTRRGTIELMQRKCTKLKGKGLTIPEALKEVIEWWGSKYVSDGKPKSVPISEFIASLSKWIPYYDSYQPEEKKPVRQKTTSIEERMKADGYA